MSPEKLEEKILPPGTDNIYIRMQINNELVGNVFGARWIYKGQSMIWVTQLCVSSKHRNQGIAKKLLGVLRQKDHSGVGILSSHPFAILAVLRVFGRGLEGIDEDLKMTKWHARAVMDTCPVGYVREAQLRGVLFEGEGEGGNGTVSCADTQFWVDHEEPLQALKVIEEKGVVWPLGELPHGHEFLVLVKARVNDHD